MVRTALEMTGPQSARVRVLTTQAVDEPDDLGLERRRRDVLPLAADPAGVEHPVGPVAGGAHEEVGEVVGRIRRDDRRDAGLAHCGLLGWGARGPSRPR